MRTFRTSYFEVHSLDCAVNPFTDGAPYGKAAYAIEVVPLASGFM